MKKLALMCIGLLLPMLAYAQDFPNAWQWLEQVRVGWCLGNQFEVFDGDEELMQQPQHPFADLATETCWGNPLVTKAMIDSVKATGFNAIRIPVRWYPHVVYDGKTTTIDPRWISRLRQVIDWCREDSLLVVINTHHEKWMDEHSDVETRTRNLPRFRSLWTSIAQAFADYDWHLAFSAMCEYHDGDSDFTMPAEATKVQAMYEANQAFVEAVRATGGNNASRILWVPTFAAEPYNNVLTYRLPQDLTPDRLVVEVHSYVPFMYSLNILPYFGQAFSHLNAEAMGQLQGILGPIDSLPASILTMTVSDTAHDSVVNRLSTQLKERGIPVVIGEFGASRKNMIGAAPDDAKLLSRRFYYTNMFRLCRKAGIKIFCWDNGPLEDPNVQVFFYDRHAGMKNIDPIITDAIMQTLED